MFDTSSADRALRGKAAIQRSIYKTGYTIAGARAWTEDERQTLRLFWPDIARLCSELPLRTDAAIKRKAGREGLTRPRRIWQEDETRRLPPPYRKGVPVEEIGEALGGKTKRQVWGKATSLGVKRPRRPPKPTGMEIVDLIRERAFKLGYTMADLDEWTNRKHYFTKPQGHDWKAIDRAFTLLGGRIVPVWIDD